MNEVARKLETQSRPLYENSADTSASSEFFRLLQKLNHRPVIAIDGPAASGKGTLSRRLANHMNFSYLDTGSLYRAVGLAILKKNKDPDNPVDAIDVARQLAKNLPIELLADPALRSGNAAQAASKVAAIPEVRAALLDLQRLFAEKPPGGRSGSILDGRDIGTVVCPHADAKIYVTANVETRATRRMKELKIRSPEVIYHDVLADLKMRDKRDSERQTAPMQMAEDAFVLDTSSLTIEQAYENALSFVMKQLDKANLTNASHSA